MRRPSLDRILAKLLGGSERFRRNFLSIASANIGAQLIGIVSLPFLTRLYTPGDFGVLAVYTACQAVLLAVSTGRFEWLAPSARSGSRAAALMLLAVMSLALSTLAVLAGTLLFGEAIAVRLGISPDNAWLLWLLPIGVLAGGLQLTLQGWHVYTADLRVMSRSKFAQSMMTLLSSLALGAAGVGAIGLLAGYIAGFWTAVLMLLRGQSSLVARLRSVTPTRIAVALRRVRAEVAASLLLALVNVLMTMSLTILTARYYDQTVVGWYSLVFRVAAAPISLITTALVHSFWADAADLAKRDPQQLRLFYLRSVRRLGAVGLLLAPIFLAGPLYIGPLLGEAEWAGAGAILAATTPYLVGLIMFSPTTHFIVYGKQRWQLVIDLATLLLSATLFHFVATFGQPAWVAIAVSSTVLLAGYLVRFAAHLKANRLLTAQFVAARPKR